MPESLQRSDHWKSPAGTSKSLLASLTLDKVQILESTSKRSLPQASVIILLPMSGLLKTSCLKPIQHFPVSVACGASNTEFVDLIFQRKHEIIKCIHLMQFRLCLDKTSAKCESFTLHTNRKTSIVEEIIIYTLLLKATFSTLILGTIQLE